jgi:hypothetical protein
MQRVGLSEADGPPRCRSTINRSAAVRWAHLTWKVGIPLLTGASRYLFALSSGDYEAAAACADYRGALEAAVAQARTSRP